MFRRWTNPLRSADRDTVSAVTQGYEAFEAKDWPRAGDLLAAAAALVDGKAAKAIWFDAALAYKFARDWPRACETGRIAVAHVKRGAEEPAYWNLATAATVLRDWDTARDAWIGYGLPPFPGTGQIDADLGPTCVRLGDVEEVVWAVRLCPTRARVTNVPFDPSRRFGEVVVHLCACCSRSSIRQERTEHDGVQQIFLGAPEDDARTLLDAWSAQRPDTRSWTNLHPA